MSREDNNFTVFSNSEYRFKLDRSRPRKKYDCQYCGCKNSFTRYIDAVSGELLSSEFGICDRINTCGAHVVPKVNDVNGELFVDSNKIKKEFRENYDLSPNCISPEYLIDSLGDYKNNNFVKFLFDNFPHDDVWETLIKYKVGTSHYPWENSTIFWQIDQDLVIRTGKIMDYNPKTCKRIKEENGWAHINWFHCQEHEDYVLEQCLFGCHLICDSTDEYNVVEGEKTAIIASIACKNKQTFLATGGQQNINEKKFIPLLDKKIIMHPDKGKAFVDWKNKVATNLSNHNITFNEKLERNKLAEDGEDIADIIIKNLKK